MSIYPYFTVTRPTGEFVARYHPADTEDPASVVRARAEAVAHARRLHGWAMSTIDRRTVLRIEPESFLSVDAAGELVPETS